VFSVFVSEGLSFGGVGLGLAAGALVSFCIFSTYVLAGVGTEDGLSIYLFSLCFRKKITPIIISAAMKNVTMIGQRYGIDSSDGVDSSPCVVWFPPWFPPCVVWFSVCVV